MPDPVVVGSMGRRRRFSAEFKSDIVAEALTSGKPLAQVARSHDLAQSLLHKWIRDAKLASTLQSVSSRTSFIRIEAKKIVTKDFSANKFTIRIRRAFPIWHKRLEKEKYTWLRRHEGPYLAISSGQLDWLLAGLDIEEAKPLEKLNYVSFSERHLACGLLTILPMKLTTEQQLAKEVDELRSSLRDHKRLLELKNEEIRYLEQQVAYFKATKYGPRSESIHPGQGTLFNEAETDAEEPADEVEFECQLQSDAGEKRRRPKRKPLPDSLKRVEEIIDLPDDKKFCIHTGSVLRRIGKEISERLEVGPAHFPVLSLMELKAMIEKLDQETFSLNILRRSQYFVFYFEVARPHLLLKHSGRGLELLGGPLLCR